MAATTKRTCATTPYIQVKDTLARIPGMGDVQLFGSGDYSMRVWLDPMKLSPRANSDRERRHARRCVSKTCRSPPVHAGPATCASER